MNKQSYKTMFYDKKIQIQFSSPLGYKFTVLKLRELKDLHRKLRITFDQPSKF